MDAGGDAEFLFGEAGEEDGVVDFGVVGALDGREAFGQQGANGLFEGGGGGLAFDPFDFADEEGFAAGGSGGFGDDVPFATLAVLAQLV